MLLSKEIYKRALNLLFTIPFISVLFTVFIISNELRDGIIIGKYFWFYGSMFFITIISPVIYFLNRNKIQITVIDCMVVTLTISILLSSIAINNNLNTTKIVTFTLLVTLYFFLRVLFSQNINSTQIILLALIITALFESVLGLMQLQGFAHSNHSLLKTTGTFFNPGPYAGYLAIIFPVALHWSLDFMKKYKKLKIINLSENKLFDKIVWNNLYEYVVGVLSILAAISIFLILPASMSRASWLALLFGSGAVIVFYYFKKTKIWIICAFVGVLALSFSGIYNLKKDSADGRLLMWKVSLQAAIQNPEGVGLGHFPAAYGKAQVKYFSLNEASEQEENVAGTPEYAFNEYLQISVESGIISFILYITLMIFAMLKAFRNNQYGIFGALISLSVFALFSYPFSMLPHLILLVSLLAATATNTNNYSKESLCGFILKGSAVLSFMIITVLCLINRYPVYKAYKNWSSNFIYGLSSEERLENYERIYPLLKDDINFLFEYAQSLARDEKREQSNTILHRAMQISCDPMLYNVMGRNYQALKQYDKAEQNFITSTLLVPHRFYPYYLLAKMYDETGDTVKAVETAEIVLTKEVKIHSPAIDEMRQEARKIINENNVIHLKQMP